MEHRWTVYCHIHIESGRRYIGITKKTMLARWNQHVYSANNRKPGRSHFWAAIRKYGKDAFSHEVLEACSTLEEANAAEERWIAHFDTTNQEKGFNLAKGGRCPYIAERRNPWDDPDYRARMTEINRRTTSDPEVKRKIGDAARGREMSTETRTLISSQKLGKTGRVTSKETKAKLAAVNWGKTVSPETRAKISSSSKGRRASPETRRRISEAGRARHAGIVRTRCKRGHELVPENVYLNPRGVRECRTCLGRRAPQAATR